MIRRAMLTMLLACASPAYAVPPPADIHSRVQVERYMRACETEWAALDVTRDPSRVKDCLADDYGGVSSRNKIVTKADAISAGPGPGDYVSTQLDYVRFRHPTPTLTIAQGGETAVRKDGSRRSLIWTDVWLLRNGRWQIVASQDNELRDTRK
jgi:hypothetical protein